MNRRDLAAVATVALAVAGATFASGASAAPVYADSLVSSEFVTAFGSGSVVGGPDGGGLWLGDSFDPPTHGGMLTVGFSGGLTTGAGADLFVVDVANSVAEAANVWVSNDNITYTFVGTLNAVANSLDIDSFYTGVFHYIRMFNASTVVSMDVDAVGGNFAARATTVPEPGTLGLLAACGLGWLGATRRRNLAAAA